MRSILRAAAALVLIGLSATAAGANNIEVELNAAQESQNKCQTSFVVVNKSDRAVQSLKLDIVVFARDNAIQRRMVVEMGPIRLAKTIVKTFELQDSCGQVGSLLVNDVAACVPGEPSACLDQLTLSSRVSSIRLFK